MFFSDNDYEVIDYKTSANGVPTHVAIKRLDPEPFILMDGLATQFTQTGIDVGIRVTGAPYLTSYRGGYYDNDGRDGSLSAAWSRFEDEFDGDESREVFARYVNVFRPGVAVYDVDLHTGCSQGDWVNLILWMDEATIDREWTDFTDRSKPLNVRRAEALGQAYQCLKGHCKEFETAATGEAYIVSVHELDATVDLDTPDMIGTEHSIRFELGDIVDDCGGVIGADYADEFGRSMLKSA